MICDSLNRAAGPLARDHALRRDATAVSQFVTELRHSELLAPQRYERVNGQVHDVEKLTHTHSLKAHATSQPLLPTQTCTTAAIPTPQRLRYRNIIDIRVHQPWTARQAWARALETHIRASNCKAYFPVTEFQALVPNTDAGAMPCGYTLACIACATSRMLHACCLPSRKA